VGPEGLSRKNFKIETQSISYMKEIGQLTTYIAVAA
jgi:hypothetical protein